MARTRPAAVLHPRICGDATSTYLGMYVCVPLYARRITCYRSASSVSAVEDSSEDAKDFESALLESSDERV